MVLAVGAGSRTVLTYDLRANLPGPDGKPIGTFRTASTVIDADDFTAENITFENTAGPVGQAIAVRVKWAKQLTASEAWKLTLQDVLGGHDGWNPKANP